jgi:hypothetical protein
MKQVQIFRTKFNQSGDYDGIELTRDGIKLSDSELERITAIAQEFYGNYNTDYSKSVELSFGQVLIKGGLHPSQSRRKFIEGWFELENEFLPSKSMNKTTEILIDTLEKLAKIETRHKDEEPNYQILKIVLKFLKENRIEIEDRELTKYLCQFVIDKME